MKRTPSRALPPLLALRAGTGQASLQSVGEEADKLQRIRALALPAGPVRRRAVPGAAAYRRRVAAEELHELRRHPDPLRLTLLAAFCHVRGREIADSLTDLLITTVHRIGTKAEKRVEGELITDLKRVAGKPALLFKLAAASLAQPDRAVRDVVFPAVGEQTLHDLVAEGMATGPVYRRHLQAVIHNSYRSHYRRMLPLVLDALSFRSNNQAHQPVLDALAVIARHAARKMRVYPADENVPLDGVVPAAWRDAVPEQDAKGRTRVNRTAYEICALQALREQLRCKEVWVEGADRYRDPDQDLPADFDARRDEHYAALGLPRDARAFIEAVRAEMTGALAALDRGMATNPYVRILKRGGGRIALTPLERQPEPAGLVALKAEIGRRWPMTSLLDMLKEADLRIGFTDALRTVTDHENLPRSVLQERLLLCLNGIGTNTGLKRMAVGPAGRHLQGPALCPAPVHHPRRPARGHRRSGERDAARPPSRHLGRGHHGVRRRQQAVRRVGPEPDDRMAPALRRERCDHPTPAVADVPLRGQVLIPGAELLAVGSARGRALPPDRGISGAQRGIGHHRDRLAQLLGGDDSAGVRRAGPDSSPRAGRRPCA